MSDVATRLSLKTLHPLFVAEITGVDLTRPLDRDDFRDNRCTLHRATPFDKTRYRRKLHRTTVAGTMPESALARMPHANVA